MRFLLFFYFIIKISILSVHIRIKYFLYRKKLTDQRVKEINNLVHIPCQKSIKLFNLDLVLIGKEHLKKDTNYIILSNHQSLFDIILFYAIFKPNICFIAKDSLFRFPFLGSGMKALGHLSINRKNYKLAYQSIMKVGKKLTENFSIIIFPEGTRYINGMGNFKSGVLHIIKKLPQANLLPVTINGTKNVHRKGWLKFKPARIKVIIHKPILFQKKVTNLKKDKNNILNKIEKIVRSKFENNY